MAVHYNVAMITMVNIDDTSGWSKWHKALCNNCQALCCTLPVEVRLPDLLRMGLIDRFDMEEAPKSIAKRLVKAGIVGHFNHKHGIFTLARHSSGACCYLDLTTRRCTIYEQRPDTCRRHPQVGPRPGFCAYHPR